MRFALGIFGFCPEGLEPSYYPIQGWFWPFDANEGLDPRGDGSFFPLVLSPETIDFLWFRVKTLKITGTVTAHRIKDYDPETYDPEDPDTEYEDFPVTVNTFLYRDSRADIADPIFPASEVDLLSSGAGIFKGGEVGPGDIGIDSALDLSQSYVNMLLSTFEPFFRFNISGGGVFSNTLQESGTVEVSAHINFFGQTVPLYDTLVEDSDESVTGTLSVSAVEYWTYTGNDGLHPIFDAATGTQLITPIPKELTGTT